jgi:hypothetical protein
MHQLFGTNVYLTNYPCNYTKHTVLTDLWHSRPQHPPPRTPDNQSTESVCGTVGHWDLSLHISMEKKLIQALLFKILDIF